MVVVGVEGDGVAIWGAINPSIGRRDGEGVFVAIEVVFDEDAELAELGLEGSDAVAFFYAERFDAFDDGGAGGEAGDGCE